MSSHTMHEMKNEPKKGSNVGLTVVILAIFALFIYTDRTLPHDAKNILYTLTGGLALFLFGMKYLSDGLQMAFGEKLKTILEKLTNNKLKGVGIGAVTTAIVQSSSITTVTLVGLINAGLITLSQSIPVIMGANIGTTITAQLIAFKIGKMALPIIAAGFLMSAFAKKDSWKYSGQVLLGFGILFLGMTTMSSEVKLLAKNKEIQHLIATLGNNPLIGVLVGALFTAVIQSSSATSGLVISMSMGSHPLLNLPAAIALIFGANIGTCITVVIASFGSTLSSKRAAAAHILFNILGVLLFVFFIRQYAHFIEGTSGELPRQIANAHMIFNIVTSLLLLNFTSQLEKIVIKLLPGEEVKVEKGVKYLDELTLGTPAIALALVEKETVRMARIAKEMIASSKQALFEKDSKEIQLAEAQESVVDDLDNKIEIFMSKINKEALSNRQRANLAVLGHAISDIERIADHANNICELAEMRIKNNINFSDVAFDELTLVFTKADQSVNDVMKVIGGGDNAVIKNIMTIEKEVDELVLEYENNHIERLEEGNCTPEAGPIYLDILRNLERITDHTHNIAYARRFGF